MRQATLCLLLKEGEILLALKKRGFGVGRWNGAGGKFDPEKDKTILDAAVRETKEEIGVQVKNPEKVGTFHFRFVNKEEWNQDVHLFLAKDWEGKIEESEEMKPNWFKFDQIPYQNMWPDDIYWLPKVLEGKKLEANFTFGQGDKILDYNIKVI